MSLAEHLEFVEEELRLLEVGDVSAGSDMRRWKRLTALRETLSLLCRGFADPQEPTDMDADLDAALRHLRDAALTAMRIASRAPERREYAEIFATAAMAVMSAEKGARILERIREDMAPRGPTP